MAQQLYSEFINFFKKHEIYDEQIFRYIEENKITFDYRDDELNYRIGYYPTTQNDILTNVTIYVPFIDNQKTLLINIYIYIHAIQLCKQLGKKINYNINTEILPMLYEKIYIKENPNEILKRYLLEQDKYTIQNGPEKQKSALKIQEKLLKYYDEKNPNFKQMEKKVKKIMKKKKVNNY